MSSRHTGRTASLPLPLRLVRRFPVLQGIPARRDRHRPAARARTRLGPAARAARRPAPTPVSTQPPEAGTYEAGLGTQILPGCRELQCGSPGGPLTRTGCRVDWVAGGFSGWWPHGASGRGGPRRRGRRPGPARRPPRRSPVHARPWSSCRPGRLRLAGPDQHPGHRVGAGRLRVASGRGCAPCSPTARRPRSHGQDGVERRPQRRVEGVDRAVALARSRSIRSPSTTTFTVASETSPSPSAGAR